MGVRATGRAGPAERSAEGMHPPPSSTPSIPIRTRQAEAEICPLGLEVPAEPVVY